MKLKLFTIAIDHHYDGTTCQVFSTVKELHAGMYELISEDISGEDTKAADAVRDLLYGKGWSFDTDGNFCGGENPDLTAAWDLWRETIADDQCDSYTTGETEIDLPEPYATAINSLRDIVQKGRGPEMFYPDFTVHPDLIKAAVVSLQAVDAVEVAP